MVTQFQQLEQSFNLQSAGIFQEVAEEETKDKKLKECIEEGDSKVTTEKHSNKRSTNNSNNSKENSDTSKEKSKITEDKKPDYIHVRARRGQATDSHSLAERVSYIFGVSAIYNIAVIFCSSEQLNQQVNSYFSQVRREKISERMRFLQDLVPGCNKITGKAGMLDEIINYVQSLQRQVEVTIVPYVFEVHARNIMIEILYLTVHYHAVPIHETGCC